MKTLLLAFALVFGLTSTVMAHPIAITSCSVELNSRALSIDLERDHDFSVSRRELDPGRVIPPGPSVRGGSEVSINWNLLLSADMLGGPGRNQAFATLGGWCGRP